MDAEPAEYRKLAIRQYPARVLRETPEGKYWRRFGAAATHKQFGAVSHIDFSNQHPFAFAVTAATRVVVYDPRTLAVRRTFARFKDTAYSGSFRADGKLLVAGGEDGVVQVFDANSRALLRQLKGHKRAAHVARFAPDKVHVLSGGDDTTVRYWDVTLGQQAARLTGHSDYVRAAAVSPASSDTWATGGYDHVCRLWDVRTKGCAMVLDHGAPIEDIAFFPSGALAVTVGGTQVRVWDMVAGGRLLRRLANHQKTVTCVRLSARAGPDSAAAPRLLTGSLDGHVKVYELDNFKVTHAAKYPGPITALGLAPDCSLLAVGMADGVLAVRKHARPKAIAPAPGTLAPKQRRPWVPRLTAANYRYFLRGTSTRAAEGDVRVAARRRARLAPHDRALRQFRYGAALDAALATRRPEVVATVLEELAQRAGLSAAIGGRDAAGLQPLLRHLCRHLPDARHTRLLTQVAHRVLDMYASAMGASPEVDELLRRLHQTVRAELKVQQILQTLQGYLEPILAASVGATGADASEAAEAPAPLLAPA